MKILYFAWLRTQIGTAEETIQMPADITTLFALIDWMKARGEPYNTALADMSAIRVAVDQEYANEDITITGANEIAFFPPVTGG